MKILTHITKTYMKRLYINKHIHEKAFKNLKDHLLKIGTSNQINFIKKVKVTSIYKNV